MFFFLFWDYPSHHLSSSLILRPKEDNSLSGELIYLHLFIYPLIQHVSIDNNCILDTMSYMGDP